MRILLLTFHYPPDLSAGSFRAAELVKALLEQLGPDARIDVITTTPNRYANMKVADVPPESLDQRIRLFRIGVPAHQNGIADQVRSFTAFAAGARRAATQCDPDIVVATSSRLATAALGASLAKRLGRPLYLDIRDVFSETISTVFKGSPIRLALPFISILERWTLRQARRINVVSPAFVDYFEPLVGHRDMSTFPNGVDDLFVHFRQRFPSLTPENPPVVLAAGNIGEGQGLHRIVPGLAAAFPGLHFRIIGGGGRRQQLADAVGKARLANVELVDPMPREQLLAEYRKASVLFMHLNDAEAFDRVIPSKMFEYCATGLPVLAGVRGYSRQILQDAEGVATFDPCDIAGSARALASLLEGPAEHDRGEFTTRYSRNAIMANMAREILDVARSG